MVDIDWAGVRAKDKLVISCRVIFSPDMSKLGDVALDFVMIRANSCLGPIYARVYFMLEDGSIGLHPYECAYVIFRETLPSCTIYHYQKNTIMVYHISMCIVRASVMNPPESR
jgi:hypothetical protein